jgi:hypothetical protein
MIFEFVHSDIMEMPTENDGSRYVITFTDDLSRGSWGYVLKFKSEALQKFRRFQAWVYRQFDTRIKRFSPTMEERTYPPVHISNREVLSLIRPHHTARTEWASGTNESHYPGEDQYSPVGCKTCSYLLDRDS